MRFSTLLSFSALATAVLANPSSLRPRSHKFAKRVDYPHKYGRSDGYDHVIAPKVFILSLFTPEGDVWLDSDLGLYAINVTVPNFSPLFPDAHCTASGDICQLVTGESEINAASTISALVLSPYFDLTKTYFLVAGIAGVNPYEGTLGSVAFARYAVQLALEYEFDAREIPANFTTGYVPLGAHVPNAYPVCLYGTEVFELNVALRDRAVRLARAHPLNDSSTAIEYRKRYDYSPANEPPSVLKCDTVTSDAFWHGALLGYSFGNYTNVITNGTGVYCMTAEEDNAILEAMIRAALHKAIDFSRIMVMRSAANFDRPPPGESPVTQLFDDNSGGFFPSLANIYIAGSPIVKDIVRKWDSTYEKGFKYKPKNYIGDILGSLKGPYAPDIGSIYHQEC